MSETELKTFIEQKMSIRQIAAETGQSYSTVRYWLKKFELKTQFDKQKDWDIEQLKEAIKTSKSRREILHKMGLRDSGSIYSTLINVCKSNNIELPKFKKTHFHEELNIEMSFRKGSNIKGKTLKKYMLSHFNVEEKCNTCSLTEWLGEKIKLEVDHIDGDSKNNDIINLRLLCPNCHSFTKTHSMNKKYLQK